MSLLKKNNPWARLLSGALATAMVVTLVPNMPANTLQAEAAATVTAGKTVSVKFMNGESQIGSTQTRTFSADDKYYVDEVETPALAAESLPEDTSTKDYVGWDWNGDGDYDGSDSAQDTFAGLVALSDDSNDNVDIDGDGNVTITVNAISNPVYTIEYQKANKANTVTGTGTIENATFAYTGNDTATVTPSALTFSAPDHYTAVGWDFMGEARGDAADGVVDAGSKWTHGNLISAANASQVVKAYAVYEEDTYTLSFVAGAHSSFSGGSIPNATVSYSEMVGGGYAASNINKYAKPDDGYKFAAWEYNKVAEDGTVAATSGNATQSQKIQTFCDSDVKLLVEGIDFAIGYTIDMSKDTAGNNIPNNVSYDWSDSNKANQTGLVYGATTDLIGLPTMEGYTAEWYAEAEDGTEVSLAGKNVSGVADAIWTVKSAHDGDTIDVYAKWTKGAAVTDAYTVTFKDGADVSVGTTITGNLGGSEIKPVTIPAVGEDELTGVTDQYLADKDEKIGYHVTSWGTSDDEVTVKPGFEYDLTTYAHANGDAVTLYPKSWAPNTYTVKFAKGTGTGSAAMEDVKMTYGKGVAAPESTYKAPDGMEFKQWGFNKIEDDPETLTGATKSTASTVAAGKQMINLSVVNGATVVLTAQYVSATKFEMRYSGGGDGEGSYTVEVPVDDAVTLTAAEAKKKGIKRTGYSFTNWKLVDRDPVGTVAAGGKVVKKSTEEYVTLEPDWVATDYSVKVVNDLKGRKTFSTGDVFFTVKVGTTTTPGVTDISYEATITDITPAFEAAALQGYTIEALYTNNYKTGTSFAKEESVEMATLAEYADADGVVLLYPAYVPNTYKLSFCAGDGEGTIDSIDVTYGVETQLPAWNGVLIAPSGKTFKGWGYAVGNSSYIASNSPALPGLIPDASTLGTYDATGKSAAIGNISKGVPSDASEAEQKGAAVVLTAQWAAGVPTHFYQKSGDEYGDTVKNLTKGAYLPAWQTVVDARDGYGFVNWTVSGGGTIADKGEISSTFNTVINNEGELNLYGNWAKTSIYNIEFYDTATSTTKTGTLDLSNLGLDGKKEFKGGDQATWFDNYEAYNKRDGWKFLGWARSKTATQPDYAKTKVVEDSKEKTVYPTIKVSDFSVEDWGTETAGSGTVGDPYYYTANLYGVWSPVDVTVTFDTNTTELTNLAFNESLIKDKVKEKVTSSEMNEQVEAYSDTLTIAPVEMTPSIAGLEFDYWTVGEDTTKYADKTKVATLIANEFGPNKVTYDAEKGYKIPLVAHWKLATKTITWNICNEQSYAATYDITGAIRAKSDAKVTIAKTTKAFTQKFTGATDVPDYFTFEGWYTDAALTKPVSGEGFEGSILEDVNLYAKYVSKEYTVEFMPNGASGTSVKQTFYATDKKALTKNSFTNSGKVFAGWALTSSGAVQYVDQAVVTLGNLGVNPSSTTFKLYASWKAAGSEFTLTFNPAGGEYTAADMKGYTNAGGGLYTIKYKNGEGYSSFPTPKRAGFTFAGYKIAQSNTPVTSISKTMAGDYVLNAQWTANQFTVKFDANKSAGQSVSGKVASVTATTDKNFKIPTDTYTKKGYRFLGYSFYPDYTKVTAAVATDSHGFPANTLFAPGAYVNIPDATAKQTITMYAQWAETSYRITYNLLGYANMDGVNNVSPVINGGAGDFYQEYKYDGKTATTLAAPKPINKGVTFVGWYKRDPFTLKYTQVKNIAKSAAEDITLYAAYKVEVEAKYHAAGAATSAPQKLVYANTLLETPKTVTLTGNKFKAANKNEKFLGWSLQEGVNTVTYGNKEVIDASTIYGLYTTPASNELNLYAVFGTSMTYTVQFWAQGAVRNGALYYPDVLTAGVREEDTYEFGKGITKTEWAAYTAPTRPGYKFAGWAEYNSGKKITSVAASATGNLVVVPIWKGGSVSLVYDVQSTKPDDSVVKTKNFTQKITLGKTINIKNTKVAASDKSAYVQGWYIADANGDYINPVTGNALYGWFPAGQTEKSLYDWNTNNIDYKWLTADSKGKLSLTLVADWRVRTMRYYYDVDNMNAYFDATTAATYGIFEDGGTWYYEDFNAGDSVTPPVASRDGYTFKGWKTIKSNGKLGGAHKKRAFSKIKWVKDKTTREMYVSNDWDYVDLRATWKADK